MLALLAWVAFVWGHSLVPGGPSSQESQVVADLLRPLLSLLGIVDASLMTLVVRKAAHFLEYSALAVLASWVRAGAGGSRWRHAPLAAALVPVVDEAIQTQVPGRCGTPVDVGIDLSGYAFGLLVAWAWSRIRASRRASTPSS